MRERERLTRTTFGSNESLTEGKNDVVDEGRVPDPVDLFRSKDVVINDEPAESRDLGEVPEAKTRTRTNG